MSKVQERYNLRVPGVIFRPFRLPTVQLSAIFFNVGPALQAEGPPFEPGTAHQPIESLDHLAIDSLPGESTWPGSR
jgi:hypothetical protein